MTSLGFPALVVAWTALALPAFIAGLKGWDWFGRVGGRPRGPLVPAQWGWFAMELPALLILPAAYATRGQWQLVTGIIVALWTLHYAHRTLIWPFTIARRGSPMPVITAAAAFAFNVVNGLLFAWFLLTLADYPADWPADPRFIAGTAAMATGAALNIWADYHLARLRRDRSERYILPTGGPYRWVSSPNLAGEILEWTGFAALTWSLPGLSFAIWTAANLIPRALWRRHWLRQRFPDHPPRRHALIPGIL